MKILTVFWGWGFNEPPKDPLAVIVLTFMTTIPLNLKGREDGNNLKLKCNRLVFLLRFNFFFLIDTFQFILYLWLISSVLNCFLLFNILPVFVCPYKGIDSLRS